MNTGTCKSCGKPILWIRTRTGRSMPCDTKPVNYRIKPGGDTKLVTPAGDVISCEAVKDPAEAEREQDIPTGAPIDMRRRKPEPRQQAEADPDPEAASRLIPGKDFDPVTGEIYEPEDDRWTTDEQTEEQPKNDGKIVVMERAAAQA